MSARSAAGYALANPPYAPEWEPHRFARDHVIVHGSHARPVASLDLIAYPPIASAHAPAVTAGAV